MKGLGAEPRSILVRIVGTDLPGRACGPYRAVRVGMQQRVGCDPEDAVFADAREVAFETSVEVRAVNGVPAFRGKAVNGPPGERFLYLTWLGRMGNEKEAMFRRAKLRLDAVPSDVLARSLGTGILVGRLGLTASDGMPVCASVRPAEIEWSAGPAATPPPPVTPRARVRRRRGS